MENIPEPIREYTIGIRVVGGGGGGGNRER